MYSKQEASFLNQKFWTSLGQYLAPIPSAEGEKINWINYKTGEKDIRFLMVAENDQAKISITFSHKDTDLQKIYVEKMLQLKNTLHQFLPQIQNQQPASLKIAALLNKPTAMKYPINIDYLGFSVPDKFLLGFGLDYDGLGRNLPQIYQLVNE